MVLVYGGLQFRGIQWVLHCIRPLVVNLFFDRFGEGPGQKLGKAGFAQTWCQVGSESDTNL